MPVANKPNDSMNRLLRRAFGGADSYVAFAEGTTLGVDVRHLSFFVPAGRSYIVSIHDIRVVNLQTAAVAGTAERFDLVRTTLVDTSGTAIVPQKLDTRSPDFDSADLDVRRAGTIGGVDTLIFPLAVIGTDEVTAGSAGQIQSDLFFPYGFGIEPIVVNPGEGVTIKQISVGAVGALGFWFAYSARTDS